MLWLSELNLSGDGQADLSVHGGPDKAVCAYPSEHLGPRADELDRELGDAPFGENLSTVGVLERDVRIGDVWEWGSATLQVTQPRWPCFKLTLHRREAHIGSGSGRAVAPGGTCASSRRARCRRRGPSSSSWSDPAGISVLDAHRAMLDRAREDPDLVWAVSPHPALADQWRVPLCAAARTLRSDVTSRCVSSTRRPKASSS